MKKTHLFFILILMSIFSLKAESEDQTPIVVRLTTDQQLLPIYLGELLGSESSLDASYLQILDKILHFDLNHNGMTSAVKRTPDKEKDLVRLNLWQNNGVYYVIKPEVKGKILCATMLVVNGHTLKTTEGMTLTGRLEEDRRQIHLLADTIHKALFDKEGIANTKIIYTLKTSDESGKKWDSEIWEIDYDGVNARQITSDGQYIVTPSHIPPKPGFSSGNIIYVSYQIGQPKIYIASLKDGKGRRLIPMRGNQLMPVISRQRDKVAFICDVGGNPDLFVQAFNPESGVVDKPQQIFSTKKGTQGTPTFSPNGTQIAFVSDKDGSPKIYVMEIPPPGASLKDINPRVITKLCRENTAPSWSPDGKKIAYCAKTQGTRQIWVYDFDTKQEKQLTQGAGNKENPSWGPNSLHLVFNSSDANSSELYMINLNQKEAVKISSGKGEKRYPSWESRTRAEMNSLTFDY